MIYQVFAGFDYYPDSFNDYICNAKSVEEAKSKLRFYIDGLEYKYLEPNWYEIVLVTEDISVLVEKGRVKG